MVAPLKPEQIKQALQRGTRAELAEFERLVSAQFDTDPSLATEAMRAQTKVNTERMRELGKKLFG